MEQVACLQIISQFLEYPEQPLWDMKADVEEAIDSLIFLSPAQKDALYAFYESLLENDVLDAQSEYTELFDRGRSLSLLLFEHVHGESRDRGQAMVDLMNQYQQAGLEIDSKELPDFLPLYLEYLSVQGRDKAVEGLKDIAPILALLGARLKERNSLYSLLFDVLLSFSNSGVKASMLAKEVESEDRDDTPQALDAVWEEEQVKFMGEEGCASAQQVAHQKRFSGSVQPQYINIDSLSGDKS
ncbi:nitrate reductase molybdenum cofactor assembly chaperone [Vibrio marisflavi]|uniref:Nitrate reductase molybdenum cofactor assembly chaperone NarJ n=1 Tax=Vibrio marisflavi CECT 7928 TaxID=634439 RepID=A0ABM9A0T7_9VIBR|nr:nitrate reductase molybdenum cofactor assembly chaperone [Vibrio marisflavi]CAH0537203.1 Nitrate reductase molybdenum cofactor assembly chaperone NarJ [Vibrio marisflavi CECT 7928]